MRMPALIFLIRINSSFLIEEVSHYQLSTIHYSFNKLYVQTYLKNPMDPSPP